MSLNIPKNVAKYSLFTTKDCYNNYYYYIIIIIIINLFYVDKT